MRICGNCGNAQGPFAAYRFGGRSGQVVYTCQSNWSSKDNAEQRKPVIACLERRAKADVKA